MLNALRISVSFTNQSVLQYFIILTTVLPTAGILSGTLLIFDGVNLHFVVARPFGFSSDLDSAFDLDWNTNT